MSKPYSKRPFTGRFTQRAALGSLHKPFELRALTGAMVIHCLGCGENGCALRVDGSRVLKVSVHEGEAPIADVVKNRGRVWPFLPIFYGAWIVPGAILGQQYPVGITLREDLIDFSPDHPKDFMGEATDFLHEAMNMKTLTQLKKLRRELEPVLDRLTSFDGRALTMLADFAVWAKNYGLDFDLDEFTGSLAITNLGQSLIDDAIVIRDLGNFEWTKRAIEHLRRATAQRSRELAS